MAFRVCCGCSMDPVYVPWRRFIRFDTALASERGTDTIDWIDAGIWGMTVPLWDRTVTATYYMKPIRFTMWGASADAIDDWLLNIQFERSYSNRNATTTADRHTYNIMPHGGQPPADSHLKSPKLEYIKFDLPCSLTYDLGYTTASTTYTAFLDAYRVNKNGTDITGIVTTISPGISWVSKAVWTPLSSGPAFFTANNQLTATLLTANEVLSPSDTFTIDLWLRFEVGGGYAPGTFYTGERGGASNTTRVTQSVRSTSSPLPSIKYIFPIEIGSANCNGKVPKQYPWTLSYSSGTPWTPGNATTFSLQSPPATSEFIDRVRSTSAQLPSDWDVTSEANIDEVVVQPAAGDGSAISFTSGPATGSVRYLCGATASAVTTSKIRVWYYAKSDASSEGVLTGVSVRYVVSGTTYVRTATPSALTGSYAWYYVEFTGSDVSPSVPGGQQISVQFDGDLTTAAAEIHVDLFYVDIYRDGAWTVTGGSSGIVAEHESGDEISFQWGREVPEIILTNYAAPTLISHPRVLYRPEDSGDYLSRAYDFGSSTELIEPAGVWNPKGVTVFKFHGVDNGSLTSYGNCEWEIEFNGTEYWASHFPAEITVTKN